MVRDAQLGFEAQQHCAAVRQLLDHRLGQMCQQYLRRGRPKKVAAGDHFCLTDIVKNKTQSSRSQKIAKVPIEKVRRYHEHCFKYEVEITDAGLYERLDQPGRRALDLHKKRRQAKPEYPSPTSTGEWYTPEELF